MTECATATPAPQVSVLMAVHNGERYLEEALRSMMDQTLRDIEIIVVDDGSSDGTGNILSRLSAEDARIRIIRSETNIGPYLAANLGLDAVRAPLVARMDADDISLPERLAVQKAFLDANPEITLVGAGVEFMDANGQRLRRKSGRPSRRYVRCYDTMALRWRARFEPGIPHPSFMFRSHAPDGAPLRYNTAFRYAQDYDFICRLLDSGLDAACLPKFLVRYRWHDSGISTAKAGEQHAIAKEIATRFQRETLPPAVFEALTEMRNMYFDGARATPQRIARLFAGARVMLAHDAAHYPGRISWIRRQTAANLKRTMQFGGMSPPAIKRAFLRHAPSLLISLKLRELEIKERLPAWLRSDPPPTGVSGSRRKPGKGTSLSRAARAR